MLFLCRLGKIFLHLSIYQHEQQGFKHHLRHSGPLLADDQLALQPLLDPAAHPLDLLAHLPDLRAADRASFARLVAHYPGILF